MALDDETKKTLLEYVSAHIADQAWHENRFSFLDDSKLATRLAEEFMAARYIYKLLEAVTAEEWLLRAQVRVQVLMYASIYEAVLHHILFSMLSDRAEVQKLLEYRKLVRISIPSASRSALEKHLEHDGKEIIPSYQGVGYLDETKIRFDAKAKCAAELGVIDEELRDELIEIYEARNAIHIHAEIRKSLNYQIELSKLAYLRMEPFYDQVSAFVARLKAIGT